MTTRQREAARQVGLLNRKHGEGQGRRTPEYRAWDSLRDRCLNRRSPRYADYGGRGIAVCTRWRDSYENFLADVGRRPSAQHTLDRFPNNDGNYEPGNVRWATKKEQASNRRNNVRLEFDGRSQLLRDWATELRLPYKTLYNRLAAGWPLERALAPRSKK